MWKIATLGKSQKLYRSYCDIEQLEVVTNFEKHQLIDIDLQMPTGKDIFSEIRDEKIIYEKLKDNVIELPTWGREY